MTQKNYNVTGKERKALVNKIAEFTGKNAVYLGMPTVSFKVGPFEVSRTGILTWEEDAGEEAENLVKDLQEAGFTAEEDRCTALAIVPETAQNAAETAENIPVEDGDGEHNNENALETTQGALEQLSISLPDDLTDEQFALLSRLIEGKETLLKHAFKADSVPVERSDGKLTFPWFTASDGAHTEVFMVFLTHLIKFAKKASRVTVHDQPVENEKFAFRVFLIRLDLIGTEYKMARKILLENLTGNSAWKDGDPKKQAV